MLQYYNDEGHWTKFSIEGRKLHTQYIHLQVTEKIKKEFGRNKLFQSSHPSAWRLWLEYLRDKVEFS